MRARGLRSWGVVVIAALLAGLASPVSADISEPRFITAWGGGDGGSFAAPFGVAVGAGGIVYVVDRPGGMIQPFAAHGEPLCCVISGGPATDFDNPRGIAVGPDGTVYVADTSAHRIQMFTRDLEFIDTFGSGPGSGVDQFNAPAGVAVGPDGSVYVADTGNHRIMRFRSDGTFLGQWGGPGFGDADFMFFGPIDVAVGPDGSVYVVDFGNEKIKRYDAAGAVHLQTWGGFGVLSGPEGVDVAPDGTVYVVEVGAIQVQVFDASGEFLTSWQTVGLGDGAFWEPRGIAAGPFGRVYVADGGNQRVHMFAFPHVVRAAGANRFETAAAVSQLHHPFFHVSTAYVATGSNFPDALAGAAAAASTTTLGVGNPPAGAPLLLTASLPPATLAELERLDDPPATTPVATLDDIVILGGEAVVSPATEAELLEFGQTKRLAGANRYATAVEISKQAFALPQFVATVMVATGENFPDALAGAPAAAALGAPPLEIGEPPHIDEARGGPILLTPRDSLPPIVADEILRLDPDQIYVLGGPAAVSDAVFDALDALRPTIRVFGPDRYATAVAISQLAFPDGAGVVYIAVGTNFPDALTGAAAAAAWGGPVLLTPTNSLPAIVMAELERLNPYAVVILGGPAVVSAAVEAQIGTMLGL